MNVSPSRMAMTQYFNAFGPHCARLRSETGTPGAIAGILKAPFDIIGDKLRGYMGLTMDMRKRTVSAGASAGARTDAASRTVSPGR